MMHKPDTAELAFPVSVAEAPRGHEIAAVETVIVDGRVLKRDGRLTHHDPVAVVREAEAALAAVRTRIRPIPGRPLPAALAQLEHQPSTPANTEAHA